MTRPFRPGEPVSAKKLNLHSAAQAQFEVGSGSMSRMGASIGSADPDMSYRGFWVRILPNSEKKVTDTTGGGQRDVYTYGWECIQLADVTDTGKGRYWVRDPGRFGSSDVDPVFASDFGKLTASEDGAFNYDQGSSRPAITAYLVVRDPASQRLIAVGGGKRGTMETKGKDIIIFILGTWDEYHLCDDVPPEPPRKENGEFCSQPYAWAAYKICGDKYKKLFDYIDYGSWAYELNNGPITAYRRFYPAVWGWDDYVDGQPTGDEGCAGVRFPGWCSLPTLQCTCPDWALDEKCIKVKFTTPPRPCPPDSDPPNCNIACWQAFQYYDENGLWDQDYEITLCGGQCSFTNPDTPPFEANFEFYEVPRGYPECDRGPDEIDPCNLCEYFGIWRLQLYGLWQSGNFNGNCSGSGHWQGFYTSEEVRDALENCQDGLPFKSKKCNQCSIFDENEVVIGHFYFVIEESIIITCCTSQEKLDCENGGDGGGGPV